MASVHKKYPPCFHSKEPIQSVAPRIEQKEKFRLEFVQMKHTTNLLCPVMSYPTPNIYIRSTMMPCRLSVFGFPYF